MASHTFGTGEEQERILHFSLSGGLEDKVLALHLDLGSLSLIGRQDGYPVLLAQQMLTAGELPVTLALLETFPDYCPNEAAYAAYTRGNTAESTVKRAKAHLDRAEAEGIWEGEMRGVRGTISRLRVKLAVLGISVRSISGTGYLLLL